MSVEKYISIPPRRKFLKTTAGLAAGATISANPLIHSFSILKHYRKPNSLINGVQIGAITYSYRSMPDQSVEGILKCVKESGLNAIELMGDPAENFAGKPKASFDRSVFRKMRQLSRKEDRTADETKELDEIKAEVDSYSAQVAHWRASAPMAQFARFRKMYNDAGVTIFGFKPNAFGKNNSDAEIEYGLKAAKALGASHVTVEIPEDDAHTMRLGHLAAKHKVYVAYHGHTQQTPTIWDTALSQSPYNAMNPDFGHYVAAGNPSPLELIKAKHDRILSSHLKDRHNLENGQANMPWGEGDTPIAEILQLMRDKKYSFPASVELEYPIPEDSDAVKEVARCVEFCRKALEG